MPAPSKLTFILFATGCFLMAASMGITNPVGLTLFLVGAILLLGSVFSLSGLVVLGYFVVALIGIFGSLKSLPGTYSSDSFESIYRFSQLLSWGVSHLAFFALVFSHYRTLQLKSTYWFRMACGSIALMLLVPEFPRLFIESRWNVDLQDVLLGCAAVVFTFWPNRWAWLLMVLGCSIFAANFVFSVFAPGQSLPPELAGYSRTHALFIAALVSWLLVLFVELYRLNLALGDDGRILFGRP